MLKILPLLSAYGKKREAPAMLTTWTEERDIRLLESIVGQEV